MATITAFIPSANWRWRLCGLLVAAMALALLPPPAAIPAPRAPAALLGWAAANPNAPAHVIVQKLSRDQGPETTVARLGGAITKDLRIINAFAAQLPARAAVQLARADGVRWVSFDSQISQSQSANSHVFTTWAAKAGALGTTCANSANIYDSALGPNGTYGACSDDDSYWSGFQPEATPGQTIAKVEVVLHGYASTTLFPTDLIELSLWKSGMVASNWTIVPPAVFAGRVGAANAGPVYIDITASRLGWQWSDLDAVDLEVDQYLFSPRHSLYLDAVGLRVTSANGAGAPADAGGDASALATIDASQQANVYNQAIGASPLWNASPKLQGKGVTVAVVDSGVYRTKDLGWRVRANVNLNHAYHDAADRYGHGTFVAGLIGGNGAQSAKKYVGVAPRADLLSVRVSDDQGMSSESDVVDALDRKSVV